jgi:hypothetical protein
VDTQQWADATVSTRPVGGRWEVWLWAGVRYRDGEVAVPGTWLVLAAFPGEAEADAYRDRAARVLENAVRLALPLEPRRFPELARRLKEAREDPHATAPVPGALTYLRLRADVADADRQGVGDQSSRRDYLADARGRMAPGDWLAARDTLRAWLAELGG